MAGLNTLNNLFEDELRDVYDAEKQILRAKLLGYRDAFNLLKANEQEEEAADAKLSKLAESAVNPSALSASTEASENEDMETSQPKRRRTA